MLIKTSDLTGSALDWAVSTFVGIEWEPGDIAAGEYGPGFKPSINWDDGGPIIESEGITVGRQVHRTEWSAECFDGSGMDMTHLRFGPTPLIAAMRCFVASTLGDSVDVPDELLAAT